MFEHASGFQIHGSTFYEVAGDVHVHNSETSLTQQQLNLAPSHSVEGHLGVGSIRGARLESLKSGTASSGVVRRTRRAVTERAVPYDNATRSSRTDSARIGATENSYTNVKSTSANVPTNGVVYHPLSSAHKIHAEDSPSSAQRVPTYLPTNPYNPIPTIHGGTFITNLIQRRGELGIQILHQAAILGAMHDSAETFPQSQCHPETREAMLDDLFAWGIGSDEHESPRDQQSDPPEILWLYGPAGAGKSAIMQTLCQRFRDAGILGGSFFFKRGDAGRGNAKSLFATLAYQLALCIPHLRRPIGESAEKDPSVVGRSMAVQLRQLIVDPSRSLEWAGPALLLIDGLDECQDERVQTEILRSIGDAAREYSIPLRFLVASRPEPHIRQILEGPQLADLTRPFNIKQSFFDVERYLRDEFARIHADHYPTMSRVPTPWPSTQALNSLVLQSSGYFIYASTVIKFIDDPNCRPTERLAIVQNLPTDPSDNPLHPLDQLYAQILCGVPARRQLLQILLAIITFSLILNEIEDLLGLEPGDAYLALRGLQSLLEIPSASPIKLHHASLQDFLRDPKRSGEFCISTSQNTLDLAQSVLKILSREQQDIRNTSWSVIMDGLGYIASSVSPSEDLVPLVKGFNPHFLWCRRMPWKYGMGIDYMDYTSIAGKTKRFIGWLEKIPFVPVDMLELWGDYHFLLVFDICLAQNREPPPSNPDIGAKSRDILTNSPPLIRLFQLRDLLAKKSTLLCPSFFQIASMSGVSWHETMMVLQPLRSFIPEYDTTRTRLADILAYMQEQTTSYLLPFDQSEASRDLARGFLRIMKANLDGCTYSWTFNVNFAHLVVLSPPCADLLSDIIDLTTWINTLAVRCDPGNAIVVWLKSFEETPLELIQFWEARERNKRKRW
ncbi:hypothetical protein B0H19DRAFT_1134888 [Mycena capillaripes]|nr:hypothetical protein B0H19DRAFT_1134888 [Mycena capillaripes]